MRVGITGARGVLGARIKTALESRNHDVDPFLGDVRNLADLTGWISGLDLVIHCAALVPVREVTEQLDRAIAVNVAGSANVGRAVAASTCRLVYISTSHVYRSSDLPLREDDPISPISAYGLTKYQGEQWVHELVKDALTVRVFSYFDARQALSYLVPSLRKRILDAKAGSTIELDGAENVRDIADARWIADACARLALSGARGVVNCGTGRRLRVADIADAVRVSLGRSDVELRYRQTGAVNQLVADATRFVSSVPDLPAFDLFAALAEFMAAAAT